MSACESACVRGRSAAASWPGLAPPVFLTAQLLCHWPAHVPACHPPCREMFTDGYDPQTGER